MSESKSEVDVEAKNKQGDEMESVAEYLQKNNFKALIEYLTAETILNRPADPFEFLQKVLATKIAQRQGGDYKAEDNTKMVQSVYAKANAHADESGRVKSHFKPVTTPSNERLEKLSKILYATRKFATETEPYEAINKIVDETCKILECDRATIFLVDHAASELLILQAEGLGNIRLPMNKGISGTVATTGQMINIPDAYQDERFDDSTDRKTGYRTKSMLVLPVTHQQQVVAVLLAINKNNGEAFNELDEEIASHLAGQAGAALQNAELHHQTRRSEEKVRSILDVVEAMHGNLGVNSLMFTITERAHTLLDADRCTLFLADHKTKELWSLQGEVNIRISMDKGIAGTVATTQQTINIGDCYADERFNSENDKKYNYQTRTMLCMPIVNPSTNVLVGVIQIINKHDGVFTTEDERLMDAFLRIAAPVLEASQLFQGANSSQTEIINEFEGRNIVRKSMKSSSAGVDAIVEGDEDEDEDEEKE